MPELDTHTPNAGAAEGIWKATFMRENRILNVDEAPLRLLFPGTSAYVVLADGTKAVIIPVSRGADDIVVTSANAVQSLRGYSRDEDVNWADPEIQQALSKLMASSELLLVIGQHAIEPIEAEVK